MIGRRLNVPVVSKTPEEAADHFGFLARFASIDVPASSARTQQLLGMAPDSAWTPRRSRSRALFRNQQICKLRRKAGGGRTPCDEKSGSADRSPGNVLAMLAIPSARPMPAAAEDKQIVNATLPSFNGAVEWLNSKPLTGAELRGKVVLVEFWTYTCVNWLRTLPYVRAWAEKYQDKGLVVIGVHTPEFGFEKNLDNVRASDEGDANRVSGCNRQQLRDLECFWE